MYICILYNLLLQLIDDLPGQFRSVVKKYNLAPGDFPEINDYQSRLREQEFSKFHSLKQKLIDDVESVLVNDIPRLMEALPRSLDPNAENEAATVSTPLVFRPNGMSVCLHVHICIVTLIYVLMKL